MENTLESDTQGSPSEHFNLPQMFAVIREWMTGDGYPYPKMPEGSTAERIAVERGVRQALYP